MMDKEDMTPLHYAARNGHSSTVSLLIKRGADVNAQTEDNPTPLHAAVESENGGNAIEVLIKAGANIHAMDNDGTPLHTAAKNGNSVGVNYLVEKGANVNARDSRSKTPLHSAASNGRNSIITFLIKQGADINARDNYNNTPLHEAAWYSVNLVLRQGLVQDSTYDTVSLLIEMGADLIRNISNNKTPFEILDVATPSIWAKSISQSVEGAKKVIDCIKQGKQERIIQRALYSLIKYAGEGKVEVHQQMDLQNLDDASIVGVGGGGIVYRITRDNKTFALKVLQLNHQSSPEDQKLCFRREVALMRYGLFPFNSNTISSYIID
jgi:ankyrin repeat protein